MRLLIGEDATFWEFVLLPQITGQTRLERYVIPKMTTQKDFSMLALLPSRVEHKSLLVLLDKALSLIVPDKKQDASLLEMVWRHSLKPLNDAEAEEEVSGHLAIDIADTIFSILIYLRKTYSCSVGKVRSSNKVEFNHTFNGLTKTCEGINCYNLFYATQRIGSSIKESSGLLNAIANSLKIDFSTIEDLLEYGADIISCLSVEEQQSLFSDFNNELLVTPINNIGFIRLLLNTSELKRSLNFMITAFQWFPSLKFAMLAHSDFMRFKRELSSKLNIQYLCYWESHELFKTICKWLSCLGDNTQEIFPLKQAILDEMLPYACLHARIHMKQTGSIEMVESDADTMVSAFKTLALSGYPNGKKILLGALNDFLKPEKLNKWLRTDSKQVYDNSKSWLNVLAKDSQFCWLVLSYAYDVAYADYSTEEFFNTFPFLVKLRSVSDEMSPFSQYIEHIQSHYPNAQRSLINHLSQLRISRVHELEPKLPTQGKFKNQMQYGGLFYRQPGMAKRIVTAKGAIDSTTLKEFESYAPDPFNAYGVIRSPMQGMPSLPSSQLLYGQPSAPKFSANGQSSPMTQEPKQEKEEDDEKQQVPLSIAEPVLSTTGENLTETMAHAIAIMPSVPTTAVMLSTSTSSEFVDDQKADTTELRMIPGG